MKNKTSWMVGFCRSLLLAASIAGCAPTSTQESTGQYIDDSSITTKVKAKIFDDRDLKSGQINVETYKGVVQLSGFVNSRQASNKAVELVKSIEGVTAVKNSMIVNAPTSTQESAGQYIDDSAITTKAKAMIFNDPDLKSGQINVETYKGVVQLSGFVNSQQESNRAVELVRSIEGVKAVKNSMIVKMTRLKTKSTLESALV